MVILSPHPCGIDLFSRTARSSKVLIKFAFDPSTAEETYKIMIQTLTADGTIADADLQELLEETKQEAGVKKPMAVKDIVDYSLLRRAAKEIGG
jgi:hypothetical protein